VKDDDRLVTQITPKSENFSRWYVEIVRRAELADYAPIKGMMVIRPYGYAIWENIQNFLDKKIKQTGHKNAYFPLFIPESYLQKETEHLEGFSPEVAWVTQGGGDELEERLAVRPTSEAIIGNMYAKWIKSYRDLPVLINQWANIVRWEKVTRLFLRTTEFLWQEGHTAHETREEAEEETMTILKLYRDFVEDQLAVSVMAGKKTESERFAGAVDTFCLESLMPDGKALQMGTSHFLGQHFSKVFNIRFEDRNQELQYVWQTSWGMTTRLVGALIMSHGDDSGLRIPPKIAPVQVVIVPISVGNWKENVLPAARELEKELIQAGIRVELDDREEHTPGWKFSEWEMRGIPVRIEIGPRDIKNNQVVMVRRDTGGKESLARENTVERSQALLDDIQQNLFRMSKEFQEQNIYKAGVMEDFTKIIERDRGFIEAAWCGNPDCEQKIKEDTSATIRIVPLESAGEGPCVLCGKKGKIVYFARAY
jgi:prolyl-tRNA synthetase